MNSLSASVDQRGEVFTASIEVDGTTYNGTGAHVGAALITLGVAVRAATRHNDPPKPSVKKDPSPLVKRKPASKSGGFMQDKWRT